MAWQLSAPHDETMLGQATVTLGPVSVGGTPPPGPYASGRQSGSNLTGTNSIMAPNRPLGAVIR